MLKSTIVDVEDSESSSEDSISENENTSRLENPKNDDEIVQSTKPTKSTQTVINNSNQSTHREENKQENLNMEASDLKKLVANIFGSEYDGEPSKLNGVLLKLQVLEKITPQADVETAVLLVKIKLTGKALDVAQSATTFQEIADLLKKSCKNSDDLVVSLYGLKLSEKDSLKDLKDMTRKIMRAHLAEGTTADVAERHTMAALRNKVNREFPMNHTMTAA